MTGQHWHHGDQHFREAGGGRPGYGWLMGNSSIPLNVTISKLEQLVPPGVAQAFELNDDKTPLWLLTRTIYRQNEQPAQGIYIWLTTRLQHLTL